MKIKGAKQVHYDSGPNMTPLVDVVMVLLIFMMLVGKFGANEHYLTSNLPISQTGAGGTPPPADFVPDEPLEVRVDSPTQDRFVARAGQIQVTSGETLTAQLTRMLNQLKAGGTPPDKVQVVISPAKNVRYKFLIECYEAALRAGFTKVSFATAR